MMSKLMVRRLAVGSIATLALGASVTVAGAATRGTAYMQYHPPKAAFVRAADGNCAALGKLIAPLGNPSALPAIASKLAIVVPAFTMALRAQDELGSPSGETALVSRWMAAMGSYLHQLAKIEAAAKAGNAADVTAANTALGTAGTQSATLSKQLGLHVCFQS